MIRSIKDILRPVWNWPPLYVLRGVLFDTKEKLLGYPSEKKRFFSLMGYEPNLAHPRTFSEYLVYKKIHDRNPLLPTLSDKYAVREYIEKNLPEGKDILIPLLYHGAPRDIPFESLPEEYIVKANHNSGPNIMVTKEKLVPRQQIIETMTEQLRRPYALFKHEWAYQKIRPRQVVVETLLRDEKGSIPKDYKFHMIRGECAFIQVDFDRFTSHTRTLYDASWNYIPGTLKFPQGREDNKPQNLDRMLEIARKLSSPFDYLRVDLYSIGDKVYFGELTHYPGSGMEPFTPKELDDRFGTYFHNE